MLKFTTKQFSYFSHRNTFSTYSSDLNLSPRQWNSLVKIPEHTLIELTNPSTNNTKLFRFINVDMTPGNEVAGWNYLSDDKLHLLIIND